MLPFEMKHRDVDSLEVSNLDKNFIKNRLRDFDFSLYKDTGKTFERNFPKDEFDVLKIPLKNKGIIVQKVFLILTRKDYVCKRKTF